MKKLIEVFTFLFLIIYSENIVAQENSYSILYEANQDGKTISGSLDKLLNYVQNGNPIRVGWVLKFKHPKSEDIIEMQHWADAGFITTLNGHVFAQINSIYQQGPSLSDPPGVFLVNDQPHGWVSVIGTTGVMRQKYKRDEETIRFMKDSGMSQEEINKQLKEQETIKVITKWAAIKN